MSSAEKAKKKQCNQECCKVSEEIKQRAAGMEKESIAERRYFHKHPELSLKETETANALCWRLASMGIEYTRVPGNGIIATIKGTAPDAYDAEGNPRRRIALRSDIDALPVTELTGAPYASENEGVMHACGHDCHMSMLLGAARILLGMTDEIHGEVRLLFQPAEECSVGSRMMIKAGALDGVDTIFGTHIWSEVDAGTISCAPGQRMANTDWFRIDIHGTSCHGAMPQRGADAVMAAAEIVNALQTIVSREISPYEPAVVTVGEIHGGTARNVIAGSAYLTGTVRTYSDTAHEMMPELIKRIVTHTAMALGADAELTDYTVANVKVENEAASSERARAALVKVLGEEAVGHYRGTLSGEDFSAYLQHVPGMLAFVGCRNPQIGATFAQHSCFYKVDESVLAKGSMLAAQYAVDFLAED